MFLARKSDTIASPSAREFCLDNNFSKNGYVSATPNNSNVPTMNEKNEYAPKALLFFPK